MLLNRLRIYVALCISNVQVQDLRSAPIADLNWPRIRQILTCLSFIGTDKGYTSGYFRGLSDSEQSEVREVLDILAFAETNPRYRALLDPFFLANTNTQAGLVVELWDMLPQAYQKAYTNGLVERLRMQLAREAFAAFFGSNMNPSIRKS